MNSNYNNTSKNIIDTTDTNDLTKAVQSYIKKKYNPPPIYITENGKLTFINS